MTPLELFGWALVPLVIAIVIMISGIVADLPEVLLTMIRNENKKDEEPVERSKTIREIEPLSKEYFDHFKERKTSSN